MDCLFVIDYQNDFVDGALGFAGAEKLDARIARRIREYGPGVPEDELPFLKNKFYKGSSKARGSGIGLAVCEEIVSRHEGRLDVGNAEGGGFEVVITMPIET